MTIHSASARRWVTACVAAVFACGVLAPPGWAQIERLPDLGAASGDELSGAAERRLGESVMRDLRADGTVFDDAELTQYLNRFAARLTATAPARANQFEFFPVRDPSINAFALPGGFIGVHTGLIAAAGSESELASVLGHEIGHVTQRHIARMLSSQRQVSMLALAGLVLGALAARSSPDAAVGGLMLGDTLATRSILSFSRDAEREADRIGLEILREARFDVRAAPRFFERLSGANRYNEGGALSYLRTHPLSAERMTDLQLRIGDMRPIEHRDALEFRLIKARALAIGSDSVDALAAAERTFEQATRRDDGAKDPAPWFGLANVAYGRRDWVGAENALDKAQSALGTPHPYLTRLRVANSLAAGDIDRAMARSAEALKSWPDSLAMIRLRAQTLIAARAWRDALTLLREKTAEHKGDAELWRLLGEAHQALGERGLAHKAAAEGYLLRGMKLPAIEQLRLARNAGDLDYYNGSIVDTRLRELEAAYREEMRDGRRF
ncbi:MAG: M48 family metalloprotease [Lautropia sp.]